MKFTNLRAFEKHLEGSAPNHFSNLYLISSKEPYVRKAGLDKALHQLLMEVKNPQLSTKLLDGESLSIDSLISDLNSVSLFAEKLVVVVQNADKLKKNATTALEGYFDRPSPKVFLLLVTAGLTATTNFYKKIEKTGVILDVAPEKPWEREKSLSDWIGSLVSSGGKRMAPDVCQHLVKQSGTNQELLEREVEKLFCYVGEAPEITLQDLGAVCCSVNMETIWQLGEAIFSCEGAKALKICQALLSEGAAFLALLKQLRSQFQTDFQVCTLLARGGSRQDVAVQFPYMKGFILDRHLQMAQNYGMERFKRGMILLDEAEFQAKNSQGDPDLLAELLMIKLTI
jgi:DNA polymerase III subunit delta